MEEPGHASEDVRAAAWEELARRGYGSDLIGGWGIGLSPRDPLDGTSLQRCGLVNAQGASVLYDRLLFPLRDWTGGLVGFAGRRLVGTGPKWLTSAEAEHFSSRSHVFGLDRAADPIRRRNLAVLMEGVTDVITSATAGLDIAVAGPGTTLSRRQALLLRRHCRRVVIMFDPDTAGRRASSSVVQLLAAAGITVHRAALEGGDPDEVVRCSGARPLLDALRAALKS